MKLVSRRRPLPAAVFVVVADTPVHAARHTPVQRMTVSDVPQAISRQGRHGRALLFFWASDGKIPSENAREENTDTQGCGKESGACRQGIG
jgi:hypothetical protein